MKTTNIEIKARSSNNDKIKDILECKGADFRGVHHQIDTYFRVPAGRLKLREDGDSMSLIFYERQNQPGPKRSDVLLYESAADSDLKETLRAALGILTIVDKRREIYFIENVKFHLDEVRELGTFMEIEAIDLDGSIGKDRLLEQCDHYLDLFKIQRSDLLSGSYGDMLPLTAT